MSYTHVVWFTSNPEVDARGYWDQALLEDVLVGKAGRLAGWLRCVHHPGGFDGLPPDTGAVVVVPGRMENGDTGPLREHLDRLPWALVVVTSDEEGAYPWWELAGPRRALWVQTPRVDPPEGADAYLPVGYTPWLHDQLAPHVPLSKVHDWFLACQVTHPRRQQCADALEPLPYGRLVRTEGFTLGLPHDEYAVELATAKVAPCPGGPVTPDTFRLWEALEAGAVPLADAQAGERDAAGYWHTLLGGLPPFPVVEEWAPTVVADALAAWPANGNRAQAWWLRWKRDLAVRLERTVAQLASGTRYSPNPADLVTVLVPTSPIPSHPSTDVLEHTLESVWAQLPGAEVVLMADGVRPEQEHRREAYDEYLRRVLQLATHRWRGRLVPLLMPEHRHQAAMTMEALRVVRTPLVLFVEHDTPLTGDIDWHLATTAVDSGAVNLLRFHHEADVHPEHVHLYPDGPQRSVLGGCPVVRTMQWSQRPHLAGADWYAEVLAEHFRPEGRTMIEDVLHSVCEVAWNEHGDTGWEQWRLAVYAPEGSMVRSLHTDGRGADPKYEMAP